MAESTLDPTFYRTAADAAAAPAERLAYVAAFDRNAEKSDAMTVVDVDPDSDTYGRVVGWSDVPGLGHELHHFGWNACSSALKHEGHDMDGLQRRYLLVPGLRSSQLHVFDTAPDPRAPTLVKTLDADDLSAKAGYSRPHTLHCGQDGIVPELLLGQKYGHAIHFWDLAAGKHLQRVDLGAEHQMALEVRPSHDPEATWGFVGVVISTEDLSGSVFRWFRDGDEWKAEKVISIPAEPADPDQLPPALKPFGAVPPIITDIDLSVDDRFLYVSCWGTGELKQFDVSDPSRPEQVGSVRLGGIVRRAAHPAAPSERLAGGPQMVEVSRDGRRIYVTNSLYGAWDDQFFPDGTGSWMAKIDTDPGTGGLTLDQRFFPHGEDWRGLRPHQVRLQGGDASSDSYCYR